MSAAKLQAPVRAKEELPRVGELADARRSSVSVVPVPMVRAAGLEAALLRHLLEANLEVEERLLQQHMQRQARLQQLLAQQQQGALTGPQHDQLLQLQRQLQAGQESDMLSASLLALAKLVGGRADAAARVLSASGEALGAGSGIITESRNAAPGEGTMVLASAPLLRRLGEVLASGEGRYGMDHRTMYRYCFGARLVPCSALHCSAVQCIHVFCRWSESEWALPLCTASTNTLAWHVWACSDLLPSLGRNLPCITDVPHAPTCTQVCRHGRRAQRRCCTPCSRHSSGSRMAVPWAACRWRTTHPPPLAHSAQASM